MFATQLQFSGEVARVIGGKEGRKVKMGEKMRHVDTQTMARTAVPPQH